MQSIETEAKRLAKADPHPVQASANNVRLEQLYRCMLRINAVENQLLSLFDKGSIRGTVHTCLGQEGIACGVIAALDTQWDIVCSNHRGHGHLHAYGGSPREHILEIMGRAGGLCGGFGGSQHLQLRNFYSNGILGGMVPVATGMAMAEKIKRSGAIVTIFLGDGALAEGAVYEGMNMASLWKLPLLMVVEDNGYAQSTPKSLEHSGSLERRGEPFGIATTVLDGNDVQRVHEAAVSVVASMRRTPEPHVLYCHTYRLAPHSKGDDLRNPLEITQARENAAIPRLRKCLDSKICTSIEQEIKQEIDQIMAELDA